MKDEAETNDVETPDKELPMSVGDASDQPIVTRHPIQPLASDDHGTLRFKGNAIVRFLLDNGKHDLNDLAYRDFPQEDWEQFAQLIGYSLSGFSELSYVRADTYDIASAMSRGQSEQEAKIQMLERKLADTRKHVKSLASLLFAIHPDDLGESMSG